MNYLLWRVGQRLRRWMRVTQEQADATGADPPLPAADVLETLKWYGTTTVGLLRAQTAHELLQLRKGDEPMTADEMTAELKAATEEMVVAMPQAELDELVARRGK